MTSLTFDRVLTERGRRRAVDHRPLFAVGMALALILAVPAPTAQAQTFDSIANGVWNGGGTVWSPAPPTNGPQTGSGTIANINGHTINYPGGVNVGGSGGNDFSVGNGGTVNINSGGLFTIDGTTNWVRLGDNPLGTGFMNINHGTFRPVTPGNVVAGTRGGTAIINLGGGANPAVFDLQTHNRALSLGEQIGGLSGNGIINIGTNGVMQGGNQIIRIGRNNDGAQPGTPWQSELNVVNGGLFNVRAGLELGSGGNARGALTIDGSGSLVAQTGGDLFIGWNGIGDALVTNGGAYTSSTGDLRIAHQATAIGSVTVSGGGTITRNTGSWAWVGERGDGTLNLQSGGQWRDTQGARFVVGGRQGASGEVNISGPTFDTNTGIGTLLENHQMAVGGFDGGSHAATGVINQSGGTVLNRGGIWLGNSAVAAAEYNMSGGELILNSFLVVAERGTGAATPNARLHLSGNAQVTQGGTSSFVVGAENGAYGRMTMADNATLTTPRQIRIGRDGGSRGELVMTGGTLIHTGEQLYVGENGRGRLEVGPGALVDRSSTGNSWVGQNSGSQGHLIVRDGGQFLQSSNAQLRVGQNSGASGIIDVSGPTWDSGSGLGSLINVHQLSLGNNGSGVLNQSGGTVISRGGFWLSQDAGGNAEYNMSGGELILNQWFVIGQNGVAGAVSPNARMHMSGNALVTMTSSGNDFVVGTNNGFGRLVMEDNATINLNRPFDIARNANSQGEVYMNGGTIHHSGGSMVLIGNTGRGVLEMTNGATFTKNGSSDIRVGQNSGSNGTLVINNATFNQAAGGDVRIGFNAGSTGSMHILNGGSFTRTTTNWSWVGQAGTGSMTIGDGGLWSSTGATGNLRIGDSVGASGNVLIEQGGTLTNAGPIVLSQQNLATAGTGGGNATLFVNGTLNSNSEILVATGSGAGSGLIGGAGTINADLRVGQRGTLMPGNSPGTLNLFGTLTFDPGAEWALNFDGTQAGTLALNGSFNGLLENITLTEGNVFDPTPNTPLWALRNQGPTSFDPTDIFANASASSPAGTSLYQDATGWVQLGGQQLAFYTSADFASGALTGGNDIVFFAIPEPGRALLLAMAAGAMLLRRRR